MDLLRFIKNEKELSSLDFEKPDITYQVWELGRVLGSLLSLYQQIEVSLSQEQEKNAPAQLVSNVTDLAENLKYLCRMLSAGEIELPAEITGMAAAIYRSSKNNKIAPSELKSMCQHVESGYREIFFFLRAISIHLCNIFVCSYGLITLQSELALRISSAGIEDSIRTNIENLEKLEKGDKVLTSPNLQITPHNLKIIRYRLSEFGKNLSVLREFAQANPEKYRETFTERAEQLQNLILDIKNPMDYISKGRKWLINVVPLIVSYYLVALVIVIGASPKLSLPLDSKIFIALLTGLFPIFASLILLVYRSIKNYLLISSFRFKISQYMTK